MTGRKVALLRGINVGTAKRIAMADLRRLFEELGYRDVRTLLNSGNVVFEGAGKGRGEEAVRIATAIADRLGVATNVVVLTANEVAVALRDNPFVRIANNPSRLLLLALDEVEAAALLESLGRERWAPEALAVRGRIAYLWCPAGIAESALWAAVNKAVGDHGTARNLATMTKLLALLDQP